MNDTGKRRKSGMWCKIQVIYGSPLPLNLIVGKNQLCTGNELNFHAGERVILNWAIYASYGKPGFDQGQNLQVALGVQNSPAYPDPIGGGQISVYKPGLNKLVPLPGDLSTLTPTFGNISFPPLSNPLEGTLTFVVPSHVTGRF